MAALTKARSLSNSGGLRPACYAFAQYGSQPVAALVSARRSYWSSRGSKSKDISHASSVYSYMKAYPNRTLPHYVKPFDDLQYAYSDSLARGRDQSARRLSNWASEDKQNDKRKSNGKAQETPWETRTRVAGERYLRLMEEHMSLLRKDPYWGLFGASELRGVWNPWRNSEALRRRVDEKTWKAWEDSKKAAEALRRTVKGELWEETTNSPKARSYRIVKTHVTPPQRESPTTTESEYVYDPISNKRVRRVSSEVPTNAAFRGPPPLSAVSDESQSSSANIPVAKYYPPNTRSDVLKTSNPRKVTKQADLAGFARQPWLTKEGFLSTNFATSYNFVDNTPSRFANDRALVARRRLQREHEAKKQASTHSASTADTAQSVVVTRSPHTVAKEPFSAEIQVLSNPAGLKTTLRRALEDPDKRRYDEVSDKRENLDLLRPETVRASVAKSAALPTSPSKLTEQQLWASLEDTAAKIIQRREKRLSQDLAASKWGLKRNWNAYPGDRPQTPEEFRDRRQLLQQSFNSSVDLLEIEVARTIGKLVVPEKREDVPDERCSAQMRGVDAHSARIHREKAQRQAEIAALLQKRADDQKAAMISSLQKEVEAQKTAMTAYEDRARAGRFSDSTSSWTPRAASGLSAKSEKSSEQKNKERALVREIRGIYESKYGVIDTKHRQPSLSSPPSISTAAAPMAPKQAVSKSDEQSSIIPRASSTSRPQTSLQRAIGESKKTSDAASNAIEKQVLARRAIPVIQPGTKLYPFDGVQEPEASHETLEASIQKFEKMMSKNTSPKGTIQHTEGNATAEVQPSGVTSMTSETASDVEHMGPFSQRADDSLTSELANIAAEAPMAEPKATQATSVRRKMAATPAQSYILLAYDKREGKVRVTSTSSGLFEASAPKRTVDSIMSRLVAPLEYFDHMEQLDKAGYELVAGGRHLLVYKDVLGRGFNPTVIDDGAPTASPERGWGSPQTEQPKAAPKEQLPRRSRSVKRVEESFSGVPPRLESERLAEDIEESQKRYKGPVWRFLRAALLVGVLFYSFGVTLEWLKDKEKRKLIEDYRKEVKRVQEIERKKAQEQVKGFGWGF